MAPISQRTLALHNGVSQRSPDVRLPSQVTTQINGLSHLTRGLTKRPGSRHLAQLDTDGTGWGRPFVHIIDRGNGEKYYLCLVNGIPRLYDVNGVAQVISIPDGLDYFILDNEPVMADFTQQRVFVPPNTIQLLGLDEYTFGPNSEYRFYLGNSGTWPFSLNSGMIEHGGIPEGLGLTPSFGSYWANVPIDDATVSVEMDLAWRNLQPSTAVPSGGLGLRNTAATVEDASTGLGACYWLRVDHASPTDPLTEGRVSIGHGTNIGDGTPMASVMVPGLTVGNQSGSVLSPKPIWGQGMEGDPIPVTTGSGFWWFRLKFTAHNDGAAVVLRAYVDNELVLEVSHVDTGFGIPTAILTPGWTGFDFGGYGDNFTFAGGGGTYVDNWKVRTGSLNVAQVPGGGTGYKALTIGDSTVIVNTTKEVDISPAMVEERPPEALIYIRQADYSTTYNITMNWTVLDPPASKGASVFVTTPALTNPAARADIATDEIAADLLTQLNAGGTLLTDGFVFTRIGSLIHVTRGGLDFDIAAVDGLSDDALLVSKGQVQRFEDLPTRCVQDYTVEVVGDPAEDTDNYWVKYDESANPGIPGVWRECPKPGEPNGWDLSTMPVILTRGFGGSWELQQGDWGARACGSVEIIPFPNIYKRKITDLFHRQGRLGFLANENVVMSRTSSILDFFRKTSKAIFDDDPIDVKASFGKSIRWHAHSMWGERLVLWSDTTQVQLMGDPLTPRTVGFEIIGEFMNSPAAEPRVVGDRVFFPQQMSGHTRIAEMFIQQFSRQPAAQEVTREVPSFIDGTPRLLAGTDQPNTLAALGSGDLDTLAMYLWRWAYDRQEQSSWSKWDLPSGSTIGWFVCHDGFLVLFVQRSDGAFLERIDLTEADVVTSIAPVFLDRRIAGAECAPVAT